MVHRSVRALGLYMSACFLRLSIPPVGCNRRGGSSIANAPLESAGRGVPYMDRDQNDTGPGPLSNWVGGSVNTPVGVRSRRATSGRFFVEVFDVGGIQFDTDVLAEHP